MSRTRCSHASGRMTNASTSAGSDSVASDVGRGGACSRRSALHRRRLARSEERAGLLAAGMVHDGHERAAPFGLRAWACELRAWACELRASSRSFARSDAGATPWGLGRTALHTRLSARSEQGNASSFEQTASNARLDAVSERLTASSFEGNGTVERRTRSDERRKASRFARTAHGSTGERLRIP
jgi:hypothetical protein